MPDVPVVILCGGRGLRLQERTHAIPKPLVEVGGRPILWHVIGLYARQGFSEFVLATGYKRELVEAFAAATPWPEGVEVGCVDTGEATPTGGRVRRLRERLGGRRFCVTYADGVADLDLAAQQAFHARHGGAATVAVVRPRLPFGVVVVGDDDAVTGFHEKPRSEQWVNGGFFVFEPAVFDHLDDADDLERAPLEALAARRQLHAFRHEGFWACLDTHKDAVTLDALWAGGRAPWARPHLSSADHGRTLQVGGHQAQEGRR